MKHEIKKIKSLENILDIAMGEKSIASIDLVNPENQKELQEGIRNLIIDCISVEDKDYKIENIYNKDYFVPIAEKKIKKENLSETGYTTIFGDVNYLKITNDSIGHTNGDNLLRTVLKTFSETAKNNGKNVLSTRKADEFLILLPSDRKKEVESYINAVKDHLKLKTYLHPDLEKKKDLDISITVAYAMGYDIGYELKDAIERADKQVIEKKAVLHKENGYSR